jgi:hypothetical protein
MISPKDGIVYRSYNVQLRHLMKFTIVADRDAALDVMCYSLCGAMRHSYSGTGYANPHAPTQIANGVSTTTLQYDSDGNAVQKTVDGTTVVQTLDYYLFGTIIRKSRRKKRVHAARKFFACLRLYLQVAQISIFPVH